MTNAHFGKQHSSNEKPSDRVKERKKTYAIPKLTARIEKIIYHPLELYFLFSFEPNRSFTSWLKSTNLIDMHASTAD